MSERDEAALGDIVYYLLEFRTFAAVVTETFVSDHHVGLYVFPCQKLPNGLQSNYVPHDPDRTLDMSWSHRENL